MNCRAWQPGLLFVGKPCDVAALRRYALLNPGANAKVPFMLSFMCAGIPSRYSTLAILKNFAVEPDRVHSFAYRGKGWPGKTRAITHEGDTFETDYSTAWGTELNRHLQFRCKISPDGIGEFADFVGADAWYGKDGYPDFAEQDGLSLVLSRTVTGEALVKSEVAAGAISVQPLVVDEIAKMQPYQAVAFFERLFREAPGRIHQGAISNQHRGRLGILGRVLLTGHDRPEQRDRSQMRKTIGRSRATSGKTQRDRRACPPAFHCG